MRNINSMMHGYREELLDVIRYEISNRKSCWNYENIVYAYLDEFNLNDSDREYIMNELMYDEIGRL